MPLTTLDPKTALIVVDLQKGIVEIPLAHPVAGIVDRSAALLKTFRGLGLPVVLVNVAGAPAGRTDAGPGAGRSFPDGWTDLIPELDRQPDDLLVTKHARSAFARTGLADRLHALGVTQVVITGIATSSGVESTARDAHELGFHVTLPVDAMTDTELARHEHSVAHIFPRIAETGTTQDVLDTLSDRR
ncbi:cysteine hydrolase [Streptomyces sp. NBC_01476]|uniref:isochorismatase family cysteine hydrolase n=1 Tax=Streptomyces sp. NBC_01476 TaxID=2903881 RepID=UPI002E311E0B|nr:isochorismatase family cysteine hydrolase [Streptomyces sp. NBC_01476]